MGFDPSGILQAHAPNPLETISTVQGIQNQRQALANAQIENQLMQLRRQHDQGVLTGQTNMGANYAATMNPDGSPNVANALTAELKDPSNALYAGEAVNQGLGQQGAQQDVRSKTAGASQAELSNATAHLQTGMQLFGGLESKKGTATAQDVDDTLATGIRSGMFNTSESFSQMMAERDRIHDQISALPKGPDGQPDPKMVDQIVRTEAGNYRQHLQDIAQHPMFVNTGAQQIPFTGSATGGLQPQAGGASVPNEMSPEAKAGRVPTVSPAGVPGSVPQATISDSQGNPRTGSAFIPTGLPPGQAEYMAGNQARVRDLQGESTATTQRLAAMKNIRAVIGSAPSTAFGPTGDVTSKIGKITTALGIAPPSVKEGQTSIDELNKSLEMIAAQQGQQMHAGTDAARATVHAANPSLSNSKEGLMQNLAVIQGNDEWTNARNSALQEWLQKNPATDENKFEAAWNKKVSPLVFQVQHMAPEQQAKLYKSMTATEKQSLVGAMRYAEAKGWLTQ